MCRNFFDSVFFHHVFQGTSSSGEGGVYWRFHRPLLLIFYNNKKRASNILIVKNICSIIRCIATKCGKIKGGVLWGKKITKKE